MAIVTRVTNRAPVHKHSEAFITMADVCFVYRQVTN